MARRGSTSDPPLRCSRHFENHRLEQQLWSEAYAQLVPPPLRPTTTRVGTLAGKKTYVGELAAHSQPRGGICA
jgi:hypothetical protein